MSSKLPHKVSVNGVEYTVSVRSTRTDPKIESCDGYCEDSTTAIVIDATLGQEAAEFTLRHELGHACCHVSGFSFLLRESIKKFVQDELTRLVNAAYECEKMQGKQREKALEANKQINDDNQHKIALEIEEVMIRTFVPTFIATLRGVK